MSARRIVAIAVTGVVAAGGAGVAIASVASKDDAKKTEQSILDNAAKRLEVPPQKLRDALAAAEDDQLDEAVKNGDLTRAQADAIKQRRKQSGTVLGHRGGGPPHDGMGRHHGPGLKLFSELAKALGLDAKELQAKLRDGKSVGEIAKAQGKSLLNVRSALKAAAKTRGDKAVDDGKLTRKQADALLERLDKRLENLDKRPRLRFHRRDRFGGGAPPHMRPSGPEPDTKPGAFAPAPERQSPAAGPPIPF